MTDEPHATSKIGNTYVATRRTTGVVQEFLFEEDAKEAGYFACTECY